MNRIIEVAVDVGRHLFADRRDVGECPPPTSPSRPLHPNCPSVEVPSAPVTFVADLRHLLDVPGRLDAWPQTSRRVSVPLPTPVVVGQRYPCIRRRNPACRGTTAVTRSACRPRSSGHVTSRPDEGVIRKWSPPISAAATRRQNRWFRISTWPFGIARCRRDRRSRYHIAG